MEVVMSVGFFLISGVLWLMEHQIKDGSLKRNGDFGIRTQLTRASDLAWEVGHQAALPLLKNSVRVSLTLGLLTVALALAIDCTGAIFAFVIAGYLAVIILVVLMARRANAAVRDLENH